MRGSKTVRVIAAMAAMAIVVGVGAGAVITLAQSGSDDSSSRRGVPVDPGPPFSGVINGIEVVPVMAQRPSHSYCPSGVASNASYSVTIGTTWEINPSYLPAGAVESNPGYVPDSLADDFVPVTLCNGQIARSFRQYLNEGPDGDWVEFSIARSASRAIAIDASEGRLASVTVAATPAVYIAPAADDDLGEAYIIVREPFGQTVIRGLGLDRDELQRIAEGLR